MAVPTGPSPGSFADEGSPCLIQWTADTTGKWTVMNIELMTGNNTNMVHMRTVVTVDGTDASNTSFTWTCPSVSPNEPIYFYQFSTPSAPSNLTWTGRFTIAGTDGSSEPAEFNSTINGQPVEWGYGTFTDPTEYNTIPSYLNGNGQVQGGPNYPGSTNSSSSAGSSSSTGVSSTTISSTPSGTSSPTSTTHSSSSSSSPTTSKSAGAMTVAPSGWNLLSLGVVGAALVFGGLAASF